MVCKSFNGLTPEYLSNVFTNRSDVTNYSLRDSVNKLAVPMPRTNALKNSFSYSGAVLWSCLPSELRRTESLNDFCRQTAQLVLRYSLTGFSINTQVIIQNRALSLARYLGLSADNHLDGQKWLLLKIDFT